MDGQTERRIDSRKDGLKKTVFFPLLYLLNFQHSMLAHAIWTKPFTTSALFSKFRHNLEERSQVILPTKYTVLNTYGC
jgi:hypothetical protein